MTTRQFPTDFTWGVATSSYQIEGAADADGRGPSIWDTFCRAPGRVRGGDTGDVACAPYRRYREDVALIKSLGVRAYRFSVAWPRVLPAGVGEVNEAGLDFYDRLVDALLAAGIEPWLTLYHWDLPQALQDAGGWPARDTARAFVDYTGHVARRLGDRVKHWITHNEPWCVAALGHELGEHAPGHRDARASLAAAHHVLLSHGLAAPVIREAAPGARVGITLNFTPATPASPSRADADAARRFDGWFNRWYLDPVCGRGYPEDVLADHRAAGVLPAGDPPWLRPGDLQAIATACDFLGVNYYTRAITRGAEAGNLPRSPRPPMEVTDMGWEIHPQSLTDLLLRLHRDYGAGPLVITENGAAWPDGPGPDGRVRDSRRVDFLARHLRACLDAIEGGAPLAGYFAWSLMDNFEWAHGYAKRFGLVHVDYATQTRTPKDSALWYRDLIARGELL